MSDRSLLKSFRYALRGVWYAIKTQPHMRIHLLCALVIIAISWFISLPFVEFLLVLTAVALVLIAELINTAIEASIDLYTREYDELARVAKNTAAGAVLVASIYALVIAGYVFLPRLLPASGGPPVPGDLSVESTVQPDATGRNTASGLAGARKAAGVVPLGGVDDMESCGGPLAVIVDNISEAYPQEGIAAADVIYEAHVEGGITRYLALYTSAVGVVGPVRSSRPYFIVLAREYSEALFVHVGGSAQALAELAQSDLTSIDELKVPQGFVRDGKRSPPSNIFANLKKLASSHEAEGDLSPYHSSISSDIGLGDLEGARRADDEVRIASYGEYDVSYVFKPQEGQYLRYRQGDPHRDVQGENVKADNVVVQYVDMERIDDEGRLQLEVIGEGEGVIFSGGWAVPIRWEKDSPESRTRFLDREGTPVPLRQGQTWIQIVPRESSVTY